MLHLCLGLLAIVSLFTIQSCREEVNSNWSNRRLIPLETGDKTSQQYVLFCSLGHDGSKCPGCVMFNGQAIHIDCQGAGNACNKASLVSLNSTGGSLSATTLDTFGFTNLDFLNMPEMSLSLEIGVGIYSYLNIPAQLVYRDTTTLQFTFTGLSFTDKPIYSNN